MPTVIDALLVTVGLDRTDFKVGTREVSADFKKTSEEATRRAKEIEAAGKRAAQFFSELRTQVLGLFAAFTLGRGVKEFLSDITTSDATVSRLARNLGISTQTLATWGKAAELAGGSADSAINSFRGFADQLQIWRSTGDSGIIRWIRELQTEGGHSIDVNKPLAETFLDIAANLQQVAKQSGLVRANFVGRQLGLDPGFVFLLVKGAEATKQLLAEATKLGTVSQAEGDAAERRRDAWIALTAAFDKVGRIIAMELTPELVKVAKLLEQFAEWAQKHPRRITAAFLGVGAAVATLSAAMIAAFGAAAVANIAAGIGAITGALEVLSAAILGTPVGWILAGLAALGVGGYVLYKNWDTWFGRNVGSAGRPAARPSSGRLTR